MANKTNEEMNIRIGKMLQAAREAGGITQNDMKDYCGLSKNHLSAVERGVSKPSVEMLIAYAEKLGVTPNDILGYGDDEPVIKKELVQMLSVMDEEQQDKIIAMIKLIM